MNVHLDAKASSKESEELKKKGVSLSSRTASEWVDDMMQRWLYPRGLEWYSESREQRCDGRVVDVEMS